MTLKKNRKGQLGDNIDTACNDQMHIHLNCGLTGFSISREGGNPQLITH